MWKNKEVKKRAKISLKANYWVIVAMCFVLTFFGIINGEGDTLLETNTSTVASLLKEPTADNLTNQIQSYEPQTFKYFESILAGDAAQTQAISQYIMNSLQGTGGIVYGVITTVDKFVFEHAGVGKFLAILYGLLVLVYSFFIKNALTVGFTRVTMESHSYGKTRFGRLFSLFRSKDYWRGCKTMITRDVILNLVALVFVGIATIGGTLYENGKMGGTFICLGISVLGMILVFIESLRLHFVPNIVACRPGIKWKEAFKLSYHMTRHNMWHLIGFYVSFLPWMILNLITVGLLDIFWLVPYRNLASAELFLTLRQKAIDMNMPYSDAINSIMMGRPHDRLIEEAEAKWQTLPDAKHEKLEKRWAPLKAAGCYPVCYPDLDPIKQNRLGKIMADRDPKRKYSLVNLILLFFIFAFIGWMWEVMIHIVKDFAFVNRGVMHGPWLPIYGVGGVMIIVLLRRFADRPPLLFVSTVIVCGIVEYFTSWFLETTKGMKWWDYSNYFLNINGRVCFEGLMAFAIGGILFVYIAGPALDNLLRKAKTLPKVIASIVLAVIFIGDMIYSHYHPNVGKGITDYGFAPQIEEEHRPLALQTGGTVPGTAQQNGTVL